MSTRPRTFRFDVDPPGDSGLHNIAHVRGLLSNAANEKSNKGSKGQFIALVQRINELLDELEAYRSWRLDVLALMRHRDLQPPPSHVPHTES